MSMASSAHLWTADEVRALPDDGNRYEAVDGELLVTPAPARVHQEASRQLFRLLDAYTRAHGVGETFFAPADIGAGRMSLVQPDLFVVPRQAPGRREWEVLRELVLAVEILSANTAIADRFTKRGLYQRQGVPEYWSVDVDARVFERWQPGDEMPELLDRRITWQPSAAHPPLEIDLNTYFTAVLGA